MNRNRHPRTHRLVALGSLMLLGAACAPSTHYQPKDTTHAYLAVVGGALALRKGGVATADGPVSQLVSCDEAARQYAFSAQQLHRDGVDLVSAANILDAFFGPVLIGTVLRGMGYAKLSSSNAALVDAINRHNDVAACTASPTLDGTVARAEVH